MTRYRDPKLGTLERIVWLMSFGRLPWPILSEASWFDSIEWLPTDSDMEDLREEFTSLGDDRHDEFRRLLNESMATVVVTSIVIFVLVAAATVLSLPFLNAQEDNMWLVPVSVIVIYGITVAMAYRGSRKLAYSSVALELLAILHHLSEDGNRWNSADFRRDLISHLEHAANALETLPTTLRGWRDPINLETQILFAKKASGLRVKQNWVAAPYATSERDLTRWLIGVFPHVVRAEWAYLEDGPIIVRTSWWARMWSFGSKLVILLLGPATAWFVLNVLNLADDLDDGGTWIWGIAALWSVTAFAVLINKGFTTDVVSVAKDTKGLIT